MQAKAGSMEVRIVHAGGDGLAVVVVELDIVIGKVCLGNQDTPSLRCVGSREPGAGRIGFLYYGRYPFFTEEYGGGGLIEGNAVEADKLVIEVHVFYMCGQLAEGDIGIKCAGGIAVVEQYVIEQYIGDGEVGGNGRCSFSDRRRLIVRWPG